MSATAARVRVGGLLLLLAACRPPAPPDPPPMTPTWSRPRRDPVGVTTRDFEDAQRGRRLATTLWYPAPADAVEETIWWDGIFPGTGAWQVPLRPGAERLPLVLLSHGSGGDGANLAWLGEYLALHGYLAAAVDHPGDRFGDESPDGRFAVWRRAGDVSAVVSQLLVDPTFGARIDRRRIGVAGHSSGGFTALALVGARFRPSALLAYCRRADAGPDCALIKDVDPHAIADLARAGRSYRDARVRAALAMMPVVGPGVTAASLRAVAVPVMIVGSIEDDLVPYGRNAARYAALIPFAKFRTVPDAGHFVFMPVCSEAGRLLVPQVCVDRSDDVDRAAVHDLTGEWAVGFFGEALGRTGAAAR
jgi:predicted dienelactone hydrolase